MRRSSRWRPSSTRRKAKAAGGADVRRPAGRRRPARRRACLPTLRRRPSWSPAARAPSRTWMVPENVDFRVEQRAFDRDPNVCLCREVEHHLWTAMAHEVDEVGGPDVEIMEAERATCAARFCEVGERSGREVVHGVDLVPLGEEAVDEIRTDESRTAGHQNSHVLASDSGRLRPTGSGRRRASSPEAPRLGPRRRSRPKGGRRHRRRRAGRRRCPRRPQAHVPRRRP